jgi:hypothetical protein
MSRADEPYEKAFAQSLWSRFKAQVLDAGAFLDWEEARTHIFDFIEM